MGNILNESLCIWSLAVCQKAEWSKQEVTVCLSGKEAGQKKVAMLTCFHADRWLLAWAACTPADWGEGAEGPTHTTASMRPTPPALSSHRHPPFELEKQQQQHRCWYRYQLEICDKSLVLKKSSLEEIQNMWTGFNKCRPGALRSFSGAWSGPIWIWSSSSGA